MPLVTTTEMFKKAYDGGYAIGAFNVNNMEIVQGITEAAREVHAPMILQVSKGARAYANHTYLVKLVEAAVIECPEIPIALHLDHGPDFETCKSCIDGGFTSVMIDASSKPFAENIEITRKVVEYAHDHGVVVEAELGALAGIEDDVNVSAEDSSYTDPNQVEEFVRATGVDSLAIACGTAHGDYPKGFIPTINFDVIKGVKQAVNMPLALHGGSGSGDENIRKAVEAGINKVNIATEIFNACRDYAKNRLDEKPDLDYMSLMMEVEQECKKTVKHFISLTGSEGKAAGFKKKYAFCHGISQIDTGIGE